MEHQQQHTHTHTHSRAKQTNKQAERETPEMTVGEEEEMVSKEEDWREDILK